MSSVELEVRRALGSVIDPCSLTAGAPLNVLDMGMITDLQVNGTGFVKISMRPTSAMCTMIAGIMKIAEESVARVPGVNGVEISLNSDSIWTEADLSDEGRQILAARRQRSREEVRVRPHEWKTRRTSAPVS